VPVVVGLDGGLTYTPAQLNIDAGDTVVFTWTGNNHDVVSSSTGCNTAAGPMNSPVLNRGATFNVTFPTAGTYPYICTVGNHCAAGMRGSVIVGGSPTSGTSNTPSPSAPVPTPSGGLSTGAIVGIVIGSLAAVALIGGLIYFLKRKRTPAPSMDLPMEKASPIKVIESNTATTSNLGETLWVPPTAQYKADDSLILEGPTTPAATKVAVAPPVTSISEGGISAGTMYSSSSARLTSTGKKLAVVDELVTQRYAGVELTSIRTFLPQSDDEIVLNQDDRILISQVFDDGWAFGMNMATRAQGMFPMSYCAKV
jgi:plastocyanin